MKAGAVLRIMNLKLYKDKDMVWKMMKFTVLFILLFLMGVKGSIAQSKFRLEDFAIPLEQITSDPEHVRVNSGYTTVNPECLTVMGVNDFFSPPFAAKTFKLRIKLQLDSIEVMDNDAGRYKKGDVGLLYAGGTWYPHKIVRRGTYHHLKNGLLLSVGVKSELYPLFGQSGFIEKVSVTNRTSRSIRVKLSPDVQAGNPYVIPLNKWQFGPPKDKGRVAIESGCDTWSNQDVTLRLFRENDHSKVLPGETLVAYFIVSTAKADDGLSHDAKQLINSATLAWEERLARYTLNIPVIESDIDGLADYYKRSLLSALVCIWENPAFSPNPFFAEGGMDGGAICTYPWGIAYYTNMATLMFGPHMKQIAQKIVDIDLEKHNQFALNGEAMGVKYSYSPYSLTKIIASIFQFLGPEENLFNATKELILNNESQAAENFLIDYGVQHNLLEMRGAGYEHYVVSPNAERSWCFDELVEMGKEINHEPEELAAWEVRSDRIGEAIRNELWDDEAQWFASVYPEGLKEIVYSVQVFDALRTRVCTPAMEGALLSHLREDAFLGAYGVSSISKEDSIHYEVLDTDWSGGGAYTGDGPELALILYEIGQPELAWDVLQRFLWMGSKLIYYPQEHFSDKPMSPSHKRANIAAGLTGAEAVLFGLVGFQPQYNGELFIHPHPVQKGTIKLEGFRFQNERFDVELSAETMRILKNEIEVYMGKPCRLKLK